MSKSLFGQTLYGAAYYHEYHPTPRLAEDMALMQDAKLSVIRVGESTWSTWEPNEGVFDLEWMQEILDAAHAAGISVIIGTPTYAMPPWLPRKHPEILAHRATGQPIPYGHRQNMDYHHPTFIKYAERIIRAIVERYANHPAVIGWQVDNEPGTEVLHNDGVFQAFKGYLLEKYKTVANLNKSWGLVYWSHEITDWDDLWRPDGNTSNSYNLEWRRFQAIVTEQFITWQAKIVRGYVPKHHFITTCISIGRPAQDVTKVAEHLDMTAVNVYYATQDGLQYPVYEPDNSALNVELPAPFWISHHGPMGFMVQADIARGIRQENFIVTETNASFTGHGPATGYFPSFPGQLRQVVLGLIARGANMVEYWHWHTLPYGTETYWGGILGHSLAPARTYKSVSEIGAMLKDAQNKLLDVQPINEVTMIYSPDSKWALGFQPPLRRKFEVGNMGDPDSYDRFFASYYDLFFSQDFGVNLRGSHKLPAAPADLLQETPILCLPALYISDDATLAYAVEFARIGGHLILTPRTGYADDISVVRQEVMPGILAKAAGLHYDEFSNLSQNTKVVASDSTMGSGVLGEAIGWADLLISDGAQILATYDHPMFKDFAAVTTNKFEKGRVTYIGTMPDQKLGRHISQWLRTVHNDPLGKRSKTESVRYSRGKSNDGKELIFLFNWSWQESEVSLPFASKNYLSNFEIVAGATITLGPWDAQVIVKN
jgi:beta-galactosidase